MNRDQRMCGGFADDGTIQRYIAGRLAGDELAGFEEHLLTCDSCHREVALAVAVREAIADSLSDVEAPADAGSGGRRIGLPPRYTALAATILLAAVAGWWFLSVRESTTQEVQRVAVLRFDNATGDPDNDYLLTGLRADLQEEFKHISGFDVVGSETTRMLSSARDSALRLLGTGAIDLVLHGMVESVGDSLRLRLELVPDAARTPKWKAEYRLPAHSTLPVMLLPRAILASIADQGVVQLGSAERRRLAIVPDVDPEARRLFNRGLHLAAGGNPARIDESIDALKAAITIDPDFARARSVLSTAYITAVYNGIIPPGEGFAAATEAASAAIAIDDNLAEAHSSLGWILASHEKDLVGALESLERGFELDPQNELAAFYYSFVLGLLGHDAEAMSIAERAARIDPLSMPMQNNVGTLHLLADRYDEAVAVYERVLQVQPGFFFAVQWQPLAYSGAGRHEDAIASARSAAASNPQLRGLLPYVLARAGQRAEAAELTQQLAAELDRGEFPFPSAIAAAYGALGDSDRAFALLDTAFERQDAGLIALKTSPEYDPLRSDPRFEAYLRRMGMSAD